MAEPLSPPSINIAVPQKHYADCYNDEEGISPISEIGTGDRTDAGALSSTEPRFEPPHQEPIEERPDVGQDQGLQPAEPSGLPTAHLQEFQPHGLPATQLSDLHREHDIGQPLRRQPDQQLEHGAAPSTQYPAATLPAWQYTDPSGQPTEEQASIAGRLHFDLQKSQPATTSSKVAAKATSEVLVTEAASSNMLAWRPLYLRRIVLSAFLASFILMIAAIETLLGISNQKDGLATSDASLHYLWTYGPTAMLTLLAAFWARVEYQSKLIMPWLRLAQPAQKADRTLLLDYTSAFQPVALYRSLQSKDVMVSLTITVSLLIKLLIIISTGLISLSPVFLDTTAISMEILDEYVDDGIRLRNTTALAYYVMTGLSNLNLTLPNGISNQYSYLTVQTNESATAQLRYTVDGLASWLDCQPAQVTISGAALPQVQVAINNMNLTVTSSGCNINLLRLVAPTYVGQGNTSTMSFLRFSPCQCDGTTDHSGERVLLLAGNLTYTVNYAINTTDYTGTQIQHPLIADLHRYQAMICEPRYVLSKVDVVRNGTQEINVVASNEVANRTLSTVQAWNILDAQARALSDNPAIEPGPYSSTTLLNSSRLLVDVDTAMSLIISTQVPVGTSFTAFLEGDFLEKSASGYYSLISAVITKQVLTRPATQHIAIAGSATISASRLIVSLWAAQWMAGVAILCVILVGFTIFCTPSRALLPRDPSSLLGLAATLSLSGQLLSRLRHSGAANEKAISMTFEGTVYRSGASLDSGNSQQRSFIIQCHASEEHDTSRTSTKPSRPYSPIILHLTSRICLLVVLSGLIVALEIMLRKSNADKGLGDVSHDTYLHYAWTAVPALVFGLLAMTVSSMDFAIRSLVPYMALKREIDTTLLLQAEFLNVSIPRALFREVRLSFSALAATLAFLVASFFTIITGSLYQTTIVSITRPATFQINQSFSLDQPLPGAGIPASLILASNLTYPKFTWDNLAFPELVFAEMVSSDSTFNASKASIEAVIPAVYGQMTCRSYGTSQITTNITLNYTIFHTDYDNPLGIWIGGEGCHLSPSSEVYRYNSILATYRNATYFAFGQDTDVEPVRGCSDLLYVWGRLDYAAKPIVQHIAALGCNISYEVTDVSATFLGTDLEFDPNNPPARLTGTEHDSTIWTTPRITSNLNSQAEIYEALVPITADPQLLDPFFNLLIRSPFAVPISYLGDQAHDADVENAIRRQHGIIQAQTLAASRTMPANQTNTTLTPAQARAGGTDADSRFAANLTSTTPRARVVQDSVATRILQGFLGATLLLAILSWVSAPHVGTVLPRPPNSIASMAALLAGGNVFGLLPPDAARLSDRELAITLGGRQTRFWLGWGPKSGEGGIESKRFGIFAERNGEDMERKQESPPWR
jgi:hypothetical protein